MTTCPLPHLHSARFLTHTLAPLLEAGFADVIDFSLVPWGNARANPATGAVECQHGPAECRLNRVLACAIAQAQASAAPWLPFVLCLEGTKAAKMEAAVDGCAADAGLDAAALHACADGPQVRGKERVEASRCSVLLLAAGSSAALSTSPPHRCLLCPQGDELEAAAASATDALKPPHTYVRRFERRERGGSAAAGGCAQKPQASRRLTPPLHCPPMCPSSAGAVGAGERDSSGRV